MVVFIQYCYYDLFSNVENIFCSQVFVIFWHSIHIYKKVIRLKHLSKDKCRPFNVNVLVIPIYFTLPHFALSFNMFSTYGYRCEIHTVTSGSGAVVSSGMKRFNQWAHRRWRPLWTCGRFPLKFIHSLDFFFSEQTKRFRTALMAVKHIKIKRDISRTFIKPSQEASQQDE